MRFGTSSALCPIQKGLLVTIQPVRDLLPGDSSGRRSDKRTRLRQRDGLRVRPCRAHGRRQDSGETSSQAEEIPLEALWLRIRRLGGLNTPTEAFSTEFRRTDEIFKEHHASEPDQLSRKFGVVSDVWNVLNSKLQTVPSAARKACVRVRPFIRLRAVNETRRQESEQVSCARKRQQ